MAGQNCNLTSHLAVLIDAENTPSTIIAGLLAEVSRYGNASIKRIYGDWTSTKLAPWKNILLKHSIHPIQQFSYTSGKNSTDIAMVIDAMDLLYNHAYLSGFCIVSSDSDFTRLASRLREAGKTVYGFGRKSTPPAFRSACSHFICTEIFNNQDQAVETTTDTVKTNNEQKAKSSSIQPTQKTVQAGTTEQIDVSKDKELIKLLLAGFESLANNKSETEISLMASYMRINKPSFSAKNYGYSRFKTFMQATKKFDLIKNGNKIKVKLAN